MTGDRMAEQLRAIRRLVDELNVPTHLEGDELALSVRVNWAIAGLKP